MMVVALVSSVAVLMGGVGGASATSLARVGTTTTITVSPTSATTSQTVTFSATITAASGGAPTGSVEFDAHFTATGGTTGTDIVLGTQTLTPGTGSASTATLSLTGMQAGTYQVTGSYSPGGSISWATSTSAVTSLSVGSVPLNTVTMSFSLSTQTITAGQSVTFSTTVSGPAGQPAPTGRVIFGAGANVTDQNTLPGGDVQLVNGTATATIGGWSGGTYVVSAEYVGDAIYAAHAQNLTLTVNPAASQAVDTTTTVTLTPTTIAAGGSVTINVHVQQVGNPTPPPAGDSVTLSVGPVGGDPTQAPALPNHESVMLDANGNASVTAGGWTVGNWVVYAGYVGDVFDNSSSGSATVTVTSPSTGTGVSYTGATSANWGDTATLSGHLVSGSSALAGKTLTFTMGGSTCSGTTNTTGDASCQIGVSALPGQHAVTVAFAGDATYQSASQDASFTVAAVPTSTSYTGATTGGTGQSVTLTAHLQRTAGSTPISGEAVTLTMGAESCTAATNGNGDASCPVTVSEGPGSYPISASFLGDGGYITSSATGNFTVAAQPTATDTSDVTANVGAAMTFSATLTSNGSPVAGKTISIHAGTQSCSGVTGSTGTASCSITLAQALGTYSITATFAGDTGFLTSSDSATLTIADIPTTTTYTGDLQANAGAAATLKAHLVVSGGSPLSGKPVTIAVGSQSCTPTTDASGNATCSITLNQPGGSYPVTATFAGDASYAASTGTATFTVVVANSKPTTVQLASVAPVLKGSSTTLSGTLRTGSTPVAGKTLTLTLGTQSCHATTNATGTATCSVTALDAAGQVQVKGAFAGDATYQASFATGTAIIYTFAPGGGSFVVGDRSDTGSVTFWGAQWSKKNSLSGGSAPDSFKGFALNPSVPVCGSTWSTDPGNSASPPAGPLPAYMAVVVTSSTSKSGSKISGNVVAIVLVKTDPGYQPNPGHAGTGTVVATLCQAAGNDNHGGNDNSGGGNGGGGGGGDNHGGNDNSGGGNGGGGGDNHGGNDNSGDNRGNSSGGDGHGGCAGYGF